MNTQTFLIRCEYPDGDRIPTQEFVENIQEYFAANIMDGERGRLIVKPAYQPKRDALFQECLDNVPQEVKDYVSLETEFSNFVALVEKMRKAQDRQEFVDSTLERESMLACRKLRKQREKEVHQAIKAYKRKRLETENEEFEYGHNVKHYSED